MRGVDITLTVEDFANMFLLPYSGRTMQDYLEALDMAERTHIQKWANIVFVEKITKLTDWKLFVYPLRKSTAQEKFTSLFYLSNRLINSEVGSLVEFSKT